MFELGAVAFERGEGGVVALAAGQLEQLGSVFEPRV